MHPRAKRALHEITAAEHKAQAELALDGFVEEFGVKWPKAAAKLTDDREALLAYYDFPAEHWVHLRTTNPIESTFAAVRAEPTSPKAPGRAQRDWRWCSS